MKPGRNDPCSCGSGKKYKHCCEGKSAPRAAGPAPDEFNQLVGLYNARRYAELENRTSALVGRYPDSGLIWKLLGVSLQMQGKNALAAFQKTAQLMPNDADAHYILGNVQKDIGQLAEAVASYRRALKIKPDFAEAHNNLGLALRKLGQVDDAMESYRRALKIKPDLVEAHNNIGNILRDTHRHEDAIASYRRALDIKPDYAEAHNNLGLALHELRQFDSAVTSYRRAIELKPDYAEAHYNLGVTLQELRQYDSAVTSYRRALELDPDYVEAHNNLGLALGSLGQFSDAQACFQKALEIKPDFVVAHISLGNLLTGLGQLGDAAECYRRALALTPDSTDARSNLLYLLNFVDDISTSYYLEQALEYGRVVADKAGRKFSSWLCAENPGRLRVGLVSGDLRIHSVGHFLEGVLSHIDPARIELIAYSTNHDEDELTERIRPFFSAWKPIAGSSDEVAARLIHDDGVHVLVDVSGFTAHNRLPLFAWKPAPVQVTWLGLPNTTGVKEIDYVLGDLQGIPPENEHHFTETVWRMPESYLCFSAPPYPVKVAPLPALSTGHVTFGSFNNLTKLNDAVVELWARILHSVPNSSLYLKTVRLNDTNICEITRKRFAKFGIAPERLILAGRKFAKADHLSEYNKIDIALDTFPYPGVTTSVEALWMGVPVLTLEGDRFLSLSAKSVAHHAGLPDWVAVDKDDYVNKAVSYTSNLEHLAKLREGLRDKVLASPLFDAKRFARNFEDALWGMWQARNRLGKVT